MRLHEKQAGYILAAAHTTLIIWKAILSVLQRVKYGVVSLKRLHRDLQHWDDLFVAGRLHKPVIHIIRGNLEVSQSIAANLDAALRLALLLLPQRFSERVRNCLIVV